MTKSARAKRSPRSRQQHSKGPADFKAEIARLKCELAAALEQQTATSEVASHQLLTRQAGAGVPGLFDEVIEAADAVDRLLDDLRRELIPPSQVPSVGRASRQPRPISWNRRW